MQPKNARAGTLFTLKSAKSRPKEREIFSGADNEAAPSARRPYTTFLWETMRGWKQRTGAVEHLDCRSVSDLMRPEIIPHSYMGNTLYDLCRWWRLTVPLANPPAALECRAHGQDLKFFFFLYPYWMRDHFCLVFVRAHDVLLHANHYRHSC